jgi:ribonuclease BN (tRNA processing enzyme)
MMRLTVLGGSAASPNTGAGCSGYLIESGETRIWLDPGPGTLLELRRHTDFRALSAVLASHMHLDHVLDLLALRHALAYNPVSATAPVPVWLPPGGAEFLDRAAAPFDECDEPGRFAATIRVAEYDPVQPIRIGDLTISFAPTVHYLPTWAMRFQGPGGATLGYTADTGPSANLDGFFRDVDLLLAEATLLATDGCEDAERGSLTAAEAGALAQASGAKQLVLTHMWEELSFDAAREEAASRYPGPIALARPGLTLDF